MATLKKRTRIESDGTTRTLAGPTMTEMAANLIRHTSDIAKSGFRLAPEDIVEARLSTCRRCAYWDESARLGLGKCNHPQCGCSKAKHIFSASRCPIGLW